MNNKRPVLSFPSSRKADIIIAILNYIKNNKTILDSRIIKIDDHFKNSLNLINLSNSSQDNSIEWFEFFRLVKQTNNKSEFYITDIGFKIINYYIKHDDFNLLDIYYMLINVIIPYKKGCQYNLADREYRVLEVMLKVFWNLQKDGKQLDSRLFDEVFYFNLNNDNYNDYKKITRLILDLNEYSRESRPVTDYLFSALEKFKVIEKVQHYIYRLTDDFKNIIEEKMIFSNSEDNSMNNNEIKLPILDDSLQVNAIPYSSEFIKYVLKKYLFDGISLKPIDLSYYNNEYDTKGFLATGVLKYYQLDTSRDNVNIGIYKGMSIDEVCDFLKKQTDQRYIKIANAIEGLNLNDIENKESILNIFKKYYISKIDEIKLEEKIFPDEKREVFYEEYPLEKIKKMELKEYSLGLDDETTFCRKIEYGKYSEFGMSCHNLNGANSWGIYFKKELNSYVDSSGNKISNPNEYWYQFRNQLFSFLNNLNYNNPDFSDKYPLLKNMVLTLNKLCFMYYPDKFVNIVSKTKLQELYNIFGLEFDYNDPGDKLSYNLNSFIKENIPEFTNEKIEYISKALFDFIDYTKTINTKEDVNEKNIIIDGDEEGRIEGGYNKIYYGVPGSGKSHKVDEDFSDKEYHKVRTTFHPEYTNSDFIGQVIPVVNEDKKVDYIFHPGAFTEQLEYALKHKDEKVCLIIEEINRGNASAIFGDIFQLLDRHKNGKHKYDIFNGPIKDYLRKKKIILEKIYIPSNMWIIATMNTSDQNVFTLDTAFKRRWKMEYIRNAFENNEESEILKNTFIKTNHKKYKDITWEKFVDKINSHILNDSSGINGEDKQLGKYFVTVEEIADEKEFAEKILSYLWEDVAKINTSYWFGSISSYEELIDEYNKNYLDVFDNIFSDEIKVSENYSIHTEGE